MPTLSVNSTKSCGVLELAEISSLPNAAAVIDRAVVLILDKYAYRAFIIFNGVTKRVYKYRPISHADTDRDYGTELADYIVKEGLGTVTASPEAVNGPSGNTMRVWVWAPDWAALQKRARAAA